MKNFARNLRIRIGKYFFNKILTKKQINNKINTNSILFLRQDGKIGDYIVSSFVFREIKKFNPHIKIGVICTYSNSYLFKQNKNIDKLYYVRKKNIFDYIKIGFEVRKEKYDVVIDPTVFIRNRDLLLLNIINAKNYVGYRKSEYSIFNLNIQKEGHFSDIYNDALSLIGINITDRNYDVPYRLKEDNEIEFYLKENKLTNFIAINFHGAGKNRQINDKNILRYLDYLHSIVKIPIVILSTPETTKSLKRLCNGYSNIFIYDTITIYHTIELIKKCSLLISVDTATVHIASGFHKKIIGLYSKDKENYQHWHPNNISETHIIFYEDNINEISPEELNPKWFTT